MTKREMMTRVAKKAGVTIKNAEKTTDAFLKTISDELEAMGKVSVAGLGTFEVRHRKERVGRNPQTGETATIPAGRYAAFKAGKQLKEKLNS